MKYRGRCSGCGWQRAVRQDGKIVRHRFRSLDGFNADTVCPGTAQPPAANGSGRGNMSHPIVETHWAIRYTTVATGASHITDYETEEDDARKALGGMAVRQQAGVREELMCRRVVLEPWELVP